MKPIRIALLALCVAAPLLAQERVEIRVDGGSPIAPFRPIWAYFGYDEPNYTYMKNGRKLIGELSALSPVPVYIRAHSLLVTGDGTPALKWGSTNAYSEDAAGKPVYDWTIVDRIFDTYINVKAKPMVELGFMPEALSTKPEPYKHTWPKGGIDTGWAYPPKDYGKWGGLVNALVKHSVEKYGKSEVESWYWEVWNEPDIMYWHGTPEEYNKMYDFAVDAVKRALPTARVGGPATTGPANQKAAGYLNQFLKHCADGKNFVTGKPGAPLDFISYHAKGRPTLVDGHVRMGIAKNLQDVSRGMEIVASFPKFKNLPIILSECDPEGCAACGVRTHPQNAYRNGTLYPVYTAAALSNIFKLADKHQANIEGMLTWAFEFEDQPYFDGFRTLATNGIDKPVLNVFRMAGLMHGDRVKVESTGTVGLDSMVKDGVSQKPDIDALATRSDRDISVMTWNYHDDDIPGPDAAVGMTVNGIPSGARRVLVRHFRIDGDHSNAYTVWKAMGSPQKPTAEQYARLEAAGQLQMLDSPRWIACDGRKAELNFSLPRQGVSLVQVNW